MEKFKKNEQWFENICKWADKYNLSKDTFPREKKSY